MESGTLFCLASQFPASRYALGHESGALRGFRQIGLHHYLSQKPVLRWLLVNNRPNDNYLNRFLIRDGKILKDDILPELFPVFVNTSTQLITQMRLESRTTSEAVCMKCDSASYNPTLYFMVDKDQIKLDSVTTIRENEKYWGKFYGYKQDESLILVPIPNRHK